FGQSARGTAPGKDGNDVDGLGDQRARDGDDSLLNELFKATERTDATAGMNGANSAGVPRAPRFQKVEGFRSPHLADGDAVGAQAQRGTDQIGKRRHAVFRSHGNEVE